MDLMPGGRQSTNELLSMIESQDVAKSYQNNLVALNYLIKNRLNRTAARKVDTMTIEMIIKYAVCILFNVF